MSFAVSIISFAQGKSIAFLIIRFTPCAKQPEINGKISNSNNHINLNNFVKKYL